MAKKAAKKSVKKAAKKSGARTSHRSTGKRSKLYAVRSASGRFEDIQTYKRAHGSDVKRVSKAELAKKAAKKGVKKAARKTTKKK